MKLKWNKQVFIVAVAFVLAAVLGIVAFGLEYDSVVREKQKLSQQLSSVEQDRSNLEQQHNRELQSKQEENTRLNSQINDLNSKIDQLNRDISSIKAMKQQVQSRNASDAASKASSRPAVNLPDLKYLTAANDGYKTCYLTFDDGPSENTLKILEILKRGNAKATFFVIHSKQENYLKNITAGGHAIGVHSYTHNYSAIYKSTNAYFNDFNQMRTSIQNITGQQVNIFRFPGGSSNAVSKKYCNGIMTRLVKEVPQKGYSYFDWNVDSGDADKNKVPKEKLITNIVNRTKGLGDICVLMHDAAAKTTTVEALPYIISYLRSQGYRFEALSKDSPTFHHSRLNN